MIGRLRRAAYAAQIGVVTAAVLIGTAGAASADDYVSVSGAGSTWSQVAIDAWRTDVAKNNLVVNYSGTGSTDGRQQYIYGTVDFGVSEIPFQTHPMDGSSPENPTRPYAYLPIVAGGTSFMYHLTVAGKRVTDLRLSGETVTKIFTGVIKNWNDPLITRDYGKQLPSIAIQPVVRSDGSGTSAQFSLYMSKQYPDLWNTFCQKYAGQTPPCGAVSFYPQFPGSTSQAGSNGVANYVAASYGEGAITYVEYAYALRLGYPVVKLLNKAGYYTSPTTANVAVGLLGAKVAADLTQDLTGVYNNPDKRTYPLSSYSYMIVPTTTDAPFNTEKGKSLSTFINYFLCAGQQKAGVLGYSPLPINLVKSGFDQVRKIPGFVEPPSGDLASCHNPTFDGGVNVLLRDAPDPPECDYVTSPPCGSATAAPAPTSTSAAGTTQGTGGTTGNVAVAGGSTAAPGSGALPGDPAAGAVDPESGLALGGAAVGTLGQAVPTVQEVDTLGASYTQRRVVYGLTAVEILLIVAAPPLLASLLRRRKKSASSVKAT